MAPVVAVAVAAMVTAAAAIAVVAAVTAAITHAQHRQTHSTRSAYRKNEHTKRLPWGKNGQGSAQGKARFVLYEGGGRQRTAGRREERGE